MMMLLVAVTVWGEGPVMGEEYTVPMTLNEWGADQIPASAILADAQSVKVKVKGCSYVKFFNGATVYSEFAYSEATKSGIYWNVSDATDLTALKSGNMYLNVGGFADVKYVSVINYPTADGAANDAASNSFGGGTGGGNNPGTGTGTGEGGGNVDPSSLAYKIANKLQITNLPTVYITIPDVTNLNTELKKDRGTGDAPYHSATMTIMDDGNDGTGIQLENLVDEPFDIKVRGNSTADPEKRPYRVKFPKGHKHDLLGYGYSKRNWTLLANCFDHSMIRNAVTYELGKEIGMPFNAGYKFVDLVINGDYRGTYQISDHVELGTNRIDIDETTGWYVEFQGRADMLDEPYVNAGGVPMFSIKNPDYTDAGNEGELAALKTEMTAWIKDYVTGWSYDPAVFVSPTKGWRAYNDEDQLVKFILETEITADYDGYMTVKAYRDPNGGKLFWGPIWDKDLAYGNYGNMEEILACSVNASSLKYYVYSPDGTNNLFHDAKFIKKLKTAYDNLMAGGIVTKIEDKIDALTALLSQSEKLNFEKWSYTENHNGLQKYYAYNTHAEYTAQLKTFVTNRLAWLGTYLAGVYNDLGCADIQDDPTGDEPFEPTTTLNYEVATGGHTIPASSFSDKATKIEVTFTSANDVDFWGFYGFNGSQWGANNFNSVNKTTTLVIDDPETIALIAQNGITFELQSNDAMGALTVLVVNTIPEEVVPCEHNLVVGASGKMQCSLCSQEFDVTVPGSEGEKVYVLDADSDSPQYITATGGFAPADNKLYMIDKQPDEGVVFDNVYWTIDGVNYADNIVVTDGTPWAGTVKVSTKKASYSRNMSTASKWGTVCIPFRAGSNDDITFYEIADFTVASDGTGTISFKNIDYTGGLNPAVYMKNDDAATNVTFTSLAKEGEEYVSFKAPAKMSKNKTIPADAPDFTFYGNVLETQTVNTSADAVPALYGISNNQFWRATSKLTVAPYRAYFTYTPSTTAAKSFVPMISLDNEETVVADVLSEQSALAIFCNGGGSVTIIAPREMTITITDLAGKSFRTISAKANGRYDVVLPMGINIINGAKVTIQ